MFLTLVQFILVSGGGGVRLVAFGITATEWSIVPAPVDDDDECGAVGGKRIDMGNPSTQRKHTAVPLCSPQIPRDLTWAGTRTAAVRNWRLAIWATARTTFYVRPVQVLLVIYFHPDKEYRFYDRTVGRSAYIQLCLPSDIKNKQTPLPLVRVRTIPTERPPLVDEI
jgi:hypothetical protein